MPHILIHTTAVKYQLRRSLRVKRLQILFHYDGFEVIAPVRISNIVILSFLWEKRHWMVRLWNSSRKAAQSVVPQNFFSENKLLYQGKMWEIRRMPGTHFEVSILNDIMFVCYSNESIDELPQQLLGWLQLTMREQLCAIQNEICPHLGQWPAKVVLKQQKTRWGSCGINQHIHINFRLIFAPGSVLRYVVIHELCHLVHRNHGKLFWNKVARYCPYFRESQAWLRKQGNDLMRLAVPDIVFSSDLPEESFRSRVESL